MESTPEQENESKAVVRVLAAVLERLVNANTPLAEIDPGLVTKFHALKAPSIDILQYIERIQKYASCSTECFILALVYIDRLIERNNFLLTKLNVHRVIITSILLAAKFFDDAYYNNAYYAKVGGVSIPEMNGLEVEFLFRINFSLHASPDVYEKYRNELISHSEVMLSVPSVVHNGGPVAKVPICFNNFNHSNMPKLGKNESMPVFEPQCAAETHQIMESRQAFTQHCGMPFQITQSPTPVPNTLISSGSHKILMHEHSKEDNSKIYEVDNGYMTTVLTNHLPTTNMVTEPVLLHPNKEFSHEKQHIPTCDPNHILNQKHIGQSGINKRNQQYDANPAVDTPPQSFPANGSEYSNYVGVQYVIDKGHTQIIPNVTSYYFHNHSLALPQRSAESNGQTWINTS